MERRRGGAGVVASSSTGSGAEAGGFGRVGGGAGGAPNRSSCMLALVTTDGVCVACTACGSFQSCDKTLQNRRKSEKPADVFDEAGL